MLICGPILRRTTPTSVSVFVATKVACTIKLIVGQSGGLHLPSAPHETRAIGASLHLAVVTLDVPETSPLAPGIVYAYDVEMTPTSSSGLPVKLADQRDLLTGNMPLGYRQTALPTFALPPSLQDLHIVHSSCRKSHGGGPDALSIVDGLINESYTDAFQRPHHLLLTGDQIYADDVAVSLLPMLIDVGGILLSQDVSEKFPDDVVMTDPLVRPGPSRDAWLRAHWDLDNEHAENHLMFLAEFCAMYMLVWSDELWARDTVTGLPRIEPFNEEEVYPLGPLHSHSPNFIRRVTDSRFKALADRAELISFAKSVRRVRRVLANVPTMMMFDDHEISDDWNLDQEWVDSSRQEAVLHRIVRNGLLAQALFQAWGNLPGRFVTGPGAALLDMVTIPSGGTRSPLSTDPVAADELLDISSALPSDATRRVQWDWTVDGPEHRIIALDTRTHREFSSSGRRGVALLSQPELQRQLTAQRPTDTSKLCFVIAPAPVVGHPLLEERLQPAKAWAKGSRAADNEAWAVNRSSFEDVLRRLAEFGRVVILSGDVHYAYTNHTAYFGAHGLPPARIVQLCASASKNADSQTRLLQTAGMAGMAQRGWFGLSTPLTDEEEKVLTRAMLAGSVQNPKALDWRYAYFQLWVEERFDPPPVIPSGFWFSDRAVEEVRRIVARAGSDGWQYQVTFVGEIPRLDLTNFSLPATLTLSPVLFELVKRLGLWVVGEPNVGQVKLRMNQGLSRLEIVHRIFWHAPGMGEDTPVVGYTEHLAPLYAPTASERPEVTP